MIVIIWETVKSVWIQVFEFLVKPPLRQEAKLFDDIASPIGEVCSYCGQRRVGMGGYCLGCGHDRGGRDKQSRDKQFSELMRGLGVTGACSPVSITDSLLIGSRIDIEV